MFALIVSTTSLYAPFATIDPTLGILTGVLIVSGVLIYAYYPVVTQNFNTLDRVVHFTVKEQFNKLTLDKIENA